MVTLSTECSMKNVFCGYVWTQNARESWEECEYVSLESCGFCVSTLKIKKQITFQMAQSQNHSNSFTNLYVERKVGMKRKLNEKLPSSHFKAKGKTVLILSAHAVIGSFKSFLWNMVIL